MEKKINDMFMMDSEPSGGSKETPKELKSLTDMSQAELDKLHQLRVLVEIEVTKFGKRPKIIIAVDETPEPMLEAKVKGQYDDFESHVKLIMADWGKEIKNDIKYATRRPARFFEGMNYGPTGEERPYVRVEVLTREGKVDNAFLNHVDYELFEALVKKPFKIKLLKQQSAIDAEEANNRSVAAWE